MEQQLEQGRIYYRELGEGRPLLVLHGGYLDHRHMMDALEPIVAMRNGWKRIYMDIPGHGRSPVHDDVTRHDEVLAMITEFMATVAPGEHFAVAGESRGGYLARGLIYQQPEIVDGALLIAPGRYAVCKDEDVPEHKTLVWADELVPTLAVDEIGRFQRLVVQNQVILDKIRRLKIPASKLADEAHQQRIDENYEFAFDVDTPARPFTRPTLFLLGRQDAMVGYRHAWSALENFPRATFAILDRAGHSLSWEQPTLFAALVNDWLDRVETFEAEPATPT